MQGVDAVLDAGRAVEPLPGSRRLVAELGERGVTSYLATNQDTWRATVMREQVAYDDLMAGSYCSCEIGLAKPDPAYFAHVLADLGLPADRVAVVHWHHDQGIDELVADLAAAGLEAVTGTVA